MSDATNFRDRMMIYRSAANIRIFPAGLYITLAACDNWAAEKGFRAAILSLLIPALVTHRVTKFRMRVPRGAVDWNERYGSLPDFQEAGSPKIEVKIVPGVHSSARVRGDIGSSVVLVTNRTALAWQQNQSVRDVQWAHESAHIGMVDAFIYYSVSTAVGIALLSQVIDNWPNILGECGSLALVFVAAISMRGYCRTRELAADSMAAGLLRDKPKEELAKSKILDANRFPLMRTHPGIDERLAVLESLSAILNGTAPFYFASGFMAVFVVLALRHALHGWVGGTSVFIGPALVSIIVGWSTSRHSALAWVSITVGQWIALFLMLSSGELCALVINDLNAARTGHFFILVGWCILATCFIALIGNFAVVEVSRICNRRIRSGSLLQKYRWMRVATGAVAVTVWIVPWFI